ncbi:hypothetical protein CYMTET_28685 [Cymbomonas tetramitiformis]|uniref:Rab proteins geranylgeranyltransferase component n=1 Tax=Cymbomonas tetramitiformis TaxID=36881 RepID=A0AAE0FNY7_9CHLO|nr:hypothetical protein CYMTET_28685 [Cymbomonas tetramitiformis]
MEELPIEPTHFDLIVVGTGLIESIVAGAASKAGKTVLQLDHAAGYGTQWASLSVGDAQNLVENLREAEASSVNLEPVVVSSSSDTIMSLPVDSSSGAGCIYDRMEVQDLVGDEFRDRMGNLHRYNLDLSAPKAASGAGAFVDLIVKSGTHHYLEFKSTEGTLMWIDGSLQPVPSSRAEVFRNKKLSAMHKRLLMRFLQACLDAKLETDLAEMPCETARADAECSSTMPVFSHPDESFFACLQSHKLPPLLQQVVLYAIALVDEAPTGSSTGRHVAKGLTAREGVRLVQLYIQSIGRFGPDQGAFLIPLYGTGELPQAFCRQAAVGGAINVLRRAVVDIQFQKCGDEAAGEGRERPGAATLPHSAGGGSWKCTAVRTSGGQQLTCGALVLNAMYMDVMRHAFEAGASPCGEQRVARAICITDASLAEGKSQVLAIFPPGCLEGVTGGPVRAMQVGQSTCAAPDGRFVVYLSAPVGSDGAGIEAVSAAVTALFRRFDPASTRTAAEEASRGKPPPRDVNLEADEAAANPAKAEERCLEEAAAPSAGEASAGQRGAESPHPPESARPQPARGADSRPLLLWAMLYTQRVAEADEVSSFP